MLNDLQRMFKETWSAFRSELGRREPEDEVAELLGLMRKELASARAQLPAHDDIVRSAESELAREREQLADCERRERLAGRIGDEETARVAREFAVRHGARVEMLDQKVAAATAEREYLRREIAQMTERYRTAEANRFALVAEIRRRRAAGTLRTALDGDEGTFADFSRMAEKIDQEGGEADALEELNETLGDRPTERKDPREVDARLEELKRRMGKK